MLQALEDRARACEQTPGLSVLDHGRLVDVYFKDLFGERRLDWRLPDWLQANFKALVNLLPPGDLMSEYHIYHDIGKPFCLTTDEEGRRHFPDHATISAAVWGASGGHPLVCRLMKHDMDLHLLKPSEADDYPHLDLVPALLLTALAEIHANSTMFGGMESTSFKIKWKALNKVGNRLTARLFKEATC